MSNNGKQNGSRGKRSWTLIQTTRQLLDQAALEYERGRDFASDARKADSTEAVYSWSQATRAFTRSQVRARQVINALMKPASSPEDLAQVEKEYA